MKNFNLIKMIKNFITAKNKYYLVVTNRYLSLSISAILALLLLLGINILHDKDAFSLSETIDHIEFFSIISTLIVALFLYLQKIVIHRFNRTLMNAPYTALLGYSENIQALLNNEDLAGSKENYLVITSRINKDEETALLKKGTGLIKGKVGDIIMSDCLDYQTMTHIVIGLGEELANIDAALTVIKAYQAYESKGTSLRIIVEVNDGGLKKLLYQNMSACNKNDKHIELQTFSFYETAVRTLFFEHDIESYGYDIINSNKPFKITVIGEGKLLAEVVYRIGLLAQLPNENELTLVLVHPNAEQIKSTLVKLFGGIEEIMRLETIVAHPEMPSFYELDIWHDPDLQRVIICDEDEACNVSVYTDLYEKTFLEDAVKSKMHCEVFVAIFQYENLIQNHHEADKDEHNAFYSFGLRKDICTRDNIIKDKDNLLGRLINYSYGDEYNPDKLMTPKDLIEVDRKWFDKAGHFDQMSSLAQADHIKVKLKAFGLAMRPVKGIALANQTDVENLLKHNRQQLDNKIKEDREKLNLSDDFLHEFSLELAKHWSGESFQVMYFPKENGTIFEKLITCEHNRWNAFHYLNGWIYSAKKDKAVKQHSCLKHFKDFKDDEQITVLYDIYSILYIPNYLANIGYEIYERKL